MLPGRPFQRHGNPDRFLAVPLQPAVIDQARINALADRSHERLAVDLPASEQVAALRAEVHLAHPPGRLREQRHRAVRAGEPNGLLLAGSRAHRQLHDRDAVKEKQDRRIPGGQGIHLLPCLGHGHVVPQRQLDHRHEAVAREPQDLRVSGRGGHRQVQRGGLRGQPLSQRRVISEPGEFAYGGKAEAVARERPVLRIFRGARVDLRAVAEEQHAPEPQALVADPLPSPLRRQAQINDPVEVRSAERPAVIGDVKRKLLAGQVQQDMDPPGRAALDRIMTVLDQFKDGAPRVLLRDILDHRLQARGEAPSVTGTADKVDAVPGHGADLLRVRRTFGCQRGGLFQEDDQALMCAGRRSSQGLVRAYLSWGAARLVLPRWTPRPVQEAGRDPGHVWPVPAHFAGSP